MVIWVAGLHMKPTVTNVWLVNLAVADLIFSLTRAISLLPKAFSLTIGLLEFFSASSMVSSSTPTCSAVFFFWLSSVWIEHSAFAIQCSPEIGGRYVRSCGQCGSLDCGGDVQLTILCVPTGLP